MRTHFEQIPVVVIERIVAQQATPAEKQSANDRKVANPPAGKAQPAVLHSREV
ncbi:MAG: hypothetical protein WB987_09795 [Candidatus Acidiferrales bacterium]